MLAVKHKLKTILSNTNKETNQMKAKLLKIEECERNRVRGFMNIMREAWDDEWPNIIS